MSIGGLRSNAPSVVASAASLWGYKLVQRHREGRKESSFQRTNLSVILDLAGIQGRITELSINSS